MPGARSSRPTASRTTNGRVKQCINEDHPDALCGVGAGVRCRRGTADGRGIHGRRRRRGWGGRGSSRDAILLVLNPDFFLERASQLVRGFLELVDAAAKRAAELRKLARAEN